MHKRYALVVLEDKYGENLLSLRSFSFPPLPSLSFLRLSSC